MALLNPTFLFGLAVLLYLSSFVVFAVLRIVTGISIQRIGYFSLRRLAYTPRDGFKIEIRGLGLNVHRPTFAQPTWLSIVVSELVFTLDIRELEKNKAAEGATEADDETTPESPVDAATQDVVPKRPMLRRAVASTTRSETWRSLMKLKDRIKRLHRNINWLRMVDVVATNSTVNVVDVGNLQVGSFTIAVDTRRKMVDRARFFLQPGRDRRKEKRQAEWITTLRSVLFTADGRESLEVLDSASLNVHGFLYEAMDGLRDAAIALKLGRVHIPYDDIKLCSERYKRCRNAAASQDGGADAPPVEVSVNNVLQELEEPGSTDHDLMQAVSDSKEFGSSILRGIKEVQFAVSFIGFTKKIDTVKPGGSPVLLNASMKEIGIDLHRLDPKSPAHRMYFPSKDIAHEALAAALSISVGVDDGDGKPQRIIYVPMATTTVKTTLPSKTVELAEDISADERNANILFANSVVTSPSVDLDPRHLPLVLAMLSPKRRAQKVQPRQRHMLISRLLPKANIKFTMHEPVVRISLPPVHQPADPDDFDLLISSISSISLDLESFHSAVEDQHYSLASTMRLQTHSLYYQTNSGARFDVLQTENFDLKVQLSASPDVRVTATGNLETFSVKLVRPEISNGLRQIVRQLRLNVEPELRSATSRTHKHHNFLRAMPSWLFHFQIQATDFRAEVAGVDEDLSDDSRGVALLLDTWTADYRANRETLHRHPSRRRATSRAQLPEVEILKMPVTPRKKHQNPGDGRRIAIHGRVLEAFIVESEDKWEVEPFVRIPRFEVAFSTLTDNQGPVFHVHSHVRTLLIQYSLYRHYTVGVATMVLRKVFLKTGKDKAAVEAAKIKARGTGPDFLAPPSSLDGGAEQLEPSKPVQEMVAIDIKASLLQVKATMPNDPSMLLQMYGLETGRHRWSPPFFHSKLVRLSVEAPRMRAVWARLISIKNSRVDYRVAKKKTAAGVHDDRMVDVNAEAIRVAIPHETIVYKVSDNVINVVKSVKQLHHRFKTGTNEYILDKGPEGPKNVPKISLRTHTFLFELEDGGFEWKLGMIYRAGRVEQMHRLAREEAFNVKVKKVREEEMRKESDRKRTRSAKPRGRLSTIASHWLRSRSEDGLGGGGGRRWRRNGGGARGRTPRYDPEGGAMGMSSDAQVGQDDARQTLDVLNASSWKKRIDRYYRMARDGMRELRGLFWGLDELPDDMEDTEKMLEVPQRPALMSSLIMDLHFQVDKPSFPLEELPDFLFKVGKGMPRDMKYGLLVPMHVQIDMGEARVSLRDYPLPLFHVPAIRSGQSHRAPALSLKTDFVIAEEFRGLESTRRVKVNIIPPRDAAGSSNSGSFAIDVRRTIGPVKSYSDMRVDINTALPTRVTWGPSYQPAIQDMMMVVESFTKPQLDPSERVGFWDKIRLNFHSRVRIAWKGDGDVHLALKGTRDPYQVIGNGAGLLMCWRNDVRWNIHATDDPKEFMTVDSGEYVLAVPDYSHQEREKSRRLGQEDGASEESYKPGASFRKVVMKLSGKVQWMAGLVFEKAIEDGRRSFEFRPHYDIVLKAPHFANNARDGLPYDAFRGFRSQHIHLSLAVQAPVDRDWTSSNPDPSRSYNTVHLTPRFFTHFFAWWSLFGGPMSLPIRQGSLWPGREKSSKKFGRHLATIKYNLLLAPLFLSHMYKHKDAEDYAQNAVSATGIKVRFDSFMLDMHQRREEFNTRDRGRKTQSRTSGMKIHAAQLDLAAADIRAVSASILGTTPDALKSKSASAMVTEQFEDGTDLSRFTIPDNDFSWIDMDDFVELDWILPTESNPDTKILPLAYAPRITYFRQTDIGGVISGDPDRTSPFGHEPTHRCIMSQDDDPRRVQAQLIRDRLAQLAEQTETHQANILEAELRFVREETEERREELEVLSRNGFVLEEKRTFLENMLQQMRGVQVPPDSDVDVDGAASGPFGHAEEDSKKPPPVVDTSVELDDGSMQLPSGAEFDSDFKNRFVVHNMQLKWNNLLRNIVLRYIHQVSQRRGFVYYLSRPAVKFILDIVEEQSKAKANNNNSASTPPGASSAKSPDPAAHDSQVAKDIEDRIKKILQDGRKFVSADDQAGGVGGEGPSHVPIEDLTARISDEFTPQSSYHVRLIAPQIQLQSDKNKKHVVLVTANGMELKVVEVMDKDRISDIVSGLVQRRFMVNMDSTQFFVTHQKWFSSQALSMYSGSTYGTPAGSTWPPWVPMEIMFDFNADPFGFRRVVQKTSATLRYDKYNTLRLKYNDEVTRESPTNDDGGDDNIPNGSAAESRMDNLRVEFPQAHALCNSSQYYAMYVIVMDLLMYNEPLEKTRSERLEKIMLASDFSDLRGAPEKVRRLQERIRQLEDIKTHFQIHSKYLDKKGWEDRLLLDRDLAACEDELFFIMKAITTSQRKYDTSSQSNALLRWSISLRDIVWHLIRENNEPLVELQLKGVEYDRTDNADGSHINLIRVASILGLNLLPNAMYPTMIAPYLDTDKGPASTLGGGDTANLQMIRVYWYMLEAIAGIPVMDHFEVNLFPMKVQLERELGSKLFEYIFPGMDGDKFTSAGSGGKNDSPFMLKQSLPGQAAEDDDGDTAESASASRSAVSFVDKPPSTPDGTGGAFSTRAGSLELRLRPTLTSEARNPTGNHAKSGKALSIHTTNEGGAFRFFRAATRKPSLESLRLQTAPTSSTNVTVRPLAGVVGGGIARSGTGFSSRAESIAGSEKKASRFSLRNRAGGGGNGGPSSSTPTLGGGGGGAGGEGGGAPGGAGGDHDANGANGKGKRRATGDDLTKMMTRASNYMTFAHIKIPSVVLCLSYKGKGDRNIEDMHDLVFRLPTIEWRNKTWSNLDLALALKTRVVKALIGHTGAIITNKFSRHHHRPNTTQQSRLREIASSSVLLGMGASGFGFGSLSSSASAAQGGGVGGSGTTPAATVAGSVGSPSLAPSDSRDNSDDSPSSSLVLGTSPAGPGGFGPFSAAVPAVDYSRSPPKRPGYVNMAGASASTSGIPLPRGPGNNNNNASRSSSVASSVSRRSYRPTVAGGGGSSPGSGSNSNNNLSVSIPSYLMMTTPPTPTAHQDDRHPSRAATGLGIGLLRRPSSTGGGGLGSLLSRPSTSSGALDGNNNNNNSKRRSVGGSSTNSTAATGGGFFKGKLTALGQKLKEEASLLHLGGGSASASTAAVDGGADNNSNNPLTRSPDQLSLRGQARNNATTSGVEEGREEEEGDDDGDEGKAGERGQGLDGGNDASGSESRSSLSSADDREGDKPPRTGKRVGWETRAKTG